MGRAIQEGKYKMKSLFRQAGVLALVVAAMASGSAFAAKNDRHGRGNPHADHGQWDGRGEQNRHRHYYRQPYVYAQPVYVPPPVYYAPQPSPGISLFFPLDARHR